MRTRSAHPAEHTQAVDGSPVHFESLEPRLLLSADCPVIDGIIADNRGLIELSVMNEPLRPASVNSGSVRVTTAGSDQLFGTNDDVLEDIDVSYDPDEGVIRIVADIEADTRYQVRLISSLIQGRNGMSLDGEFNGADMPTGDGTAGGDLVFFARRAADPIARFRTALGDIDVQLFPETTPITVQNFFNYANSGRYDGTLFHRLVEDFVIQGGGFTAEPPFEQVEEDDPIQNEPFLSNTRGTIGLAKLGGQPNSGTSQWYFNLTDNSSNLDNQNGGFTVFGEILDDEGLAIMDMLGMLETFDASSLQGAFADLPLLDLEGIDNADDLTMEDVASIDRISILMDVVAEVPGQLDAESFRFESEGDAAVTVFDFDGVGLGAIEDGVKVRFDGDRIRSIIFQKDFDASGIGIVITDATSVGSIKDARRGDLSDIGFIVSFAPINNINIKGDIEGMNLNGMVVGGMLLPDDIDGDGSLADRTAIYVMEGDVRKIIMQGDVRGDILAPGGASVVDIRGEFSDGDLRIGEIENRLSVLRFSRLHNVDIITETPIAKLIADHWDRSDPDPNRLRAPSVNRLIMNGDRRNGVEGNLEADIVLTGAEQGRTLGKMVVRGALLNSSIDVVGDSGPMTLRGGASNVDINIDGALIKLVAGAMSNVKLTADDGVRVIAADEWFGGSLDTSTVNKMVIRGNRSDFVNGDLAIDLNTTGSFNERFSIRNIRVAGDLLLGDWSIADEAAKIIVKGDVSDMNIDADVSVQRFFAGAVTDTTLTSGNNMGRIQVDSWQGGTIETGVLNLFNVTGNKRTGDNGDFSGRIDVFESETIRVAGDVRDSFMRFAQGVNDPLPALGYLNVQGEMSSSTVRTRGSLGDLRIGGMQSSTIAAGVNQNAMFTGFAEQSQVNSLAVIRSIRVFDSSGDSDFTFRDSFIIASGVDRATLGAVDSANANAPFGVAVNQINSLRYTNEAGDVIDAVGPRSTPSDRLVGDFQLRLNFQVPDGVTPLI